MSDKITIINRVDDTICVAFKKSYPGSKDVAYNEHMGTTTIAPGVTKDVPILCSASPDYLYNVALTSMVTSNGSLYNPLQGSVLNFSPTPLYVHNVALDSIVTIASKVSVQGVNETSG